MPTFLGQVQSGCKWLRTKYTRIHLPTEWDCFFAWEFDRLCFSKASGKIQSTIVYFYSVINEYHSLCSRDNREFKIRRPRTTATDKYATAHDQNHVTVHFSRVVMRLRWVVELFRVVGTTENILLVFCRLGSSRISPFRKKSFQFTCFKSEESEICKLCLISAQIYAFNPLLWVHFYLAKLMFK